MPLTGIVMLPALADSSVELTVALREDIAAGGAIAGEFASQGVRPIAINISPNYQVMSRAEPVETLEQFKGKVWRSGGGSMNLAISSLGGAPAEMPGGDMYIALQRGTLDGTILSSISVKPYSVQEVVDYMSTNAQFGQYATIFVIGSDYYNSLSDENRKVVNDCGLKIEAKMAEETDRVDTELFNEFASGGVKTYALTEETRKDFNEALKPVIEDYLVRVEERGLPGRDTYAGLQKRLGK
jgi:TRAP-type C4-dicarboxylate transport system substrate-binding protein